MNYNGYGEEGPSYLGSTEPSYLDNSYGDYGASRTVAGRGGYTYRQYDDGRIKIEAGPDSVGTTVSQGASWVAITTEIGPYPSEAEQARTERYGEGGRAAQVITGLARGLQLPSFVESGLSTPASGAPLTEGNGNGNGGEKAGMPTWAMIALGVGGVAIVGGLIYAARSK